MAINYGFFDSVNGDRKYSAEDIGRYLQGIISSGVYADSITSLQVLAGEGMQVEVQAGRAMLNYHFLENDGPLVLTLSAAGTQDRIDAIVARLDMEQRLCEIAVKDGTPAADPQRPSVVRTDNTKEYMLAAIYVAKLSTAITQENITDTRADTSVCGWVTGLIEQGVLGLPVPYPADALKIPVVNADGNGYELLPTDNTLSFAGSPADAAAVGANLERKVGKFDLLWSNGSPGNGWGETPISLGEEVINNYSWLMITFRSHKGSAYYQRAFIPVDLQSGLSTSQRSRLETVMGGGYYRDVSITDAGLSFTTVTKYDGSATSNEYCTPMQIHGCNLT